MKNFKKLLSVIVVFCMLMSSFAAVSASAATDEIKVNLDGNYISFDVAPQLIGGRTMVPLRAIFEALGATVEWDDQTKTVTSYNEFYMVKCSIGQNEMYVNNQARTMDIAPMVVDGRTLVPARFVAEAFNCKVDWDAQNKTVNITSSKADYTQIEKPTDYSQNESSSTSKNEKTEQVSSTKGTLKNPYSAKEGKTIIFQEWSHHPQQKVAIKCTNVIRGSAANSLAHSENRFNDEPNSSQEWCFLEFDVEYISSLGEEEVLEGSDIIYDDTFFTTTGSKLNVADMATLGDTYRGYGVFDTEFYPGGSGKVVIGILINKDVGDILLRVPNDSENTNTWINCTAGVTGKQYSSSSESNKSTGSYDNGCYPGTSVPTYTSATKVSLKKSDVLDNGTPVYIYRYTDADDVALYWEKLVGKGWTMFSGDDETTSETFESTFVKGSMGLIVDVALNRDEVWITYFSID